MRPHQDDQIDFPVTKIMLNISRPSLLHLCRAPKLFPYSAGRLTRRRL